MKRTTPKRKTKGFRGSMTHGWGSKKKHRGKGSHGGKGMAGTGKRADTKKPTIINLYGNSYFGRHGFVVPGAKAYKAINLKDVAVLAEKNALKEINLEDFGYQKLLATGNIHSALKITVAMASESAIEKVKNAGGQVILSEE
ncbi:uL15 family ribosomal protein [Candidatus Woesearchaeota archaeon]|nr:uL15 family ribosomal protein [Candidatus Woesearchaeota archaeon]